MPDARLMSGVFLGFALSQKCGCVNAYSLCSTGQLLFNYPVVGKVALLGISWKKNTRMEIS
jgi:hypothetical protein